MLFQKVAHALHQISAITSRTEITQHLAALLQHTTPREAQVLAYLAQGILRPSYRGTQFSIAEKSMKKIVAQLMDISESEVVHRLKKSGDLGTIAEEGEWHPAHELSVLAVYEKLEAIEQLTGTGSQEERAHQLLLLLKSVDPLSAGLIIRIILGKLRLGFSDMTLIDALSWMLTGNKSLHEKIENAYNLCADIGLIAHQLKIHGEAGLKDISIVVGIPIRPAAAERLPSAQDIIEKIGPCVAQPKIDGFRLQVHLSKEKKHPVMSFFSRNLLDMSAMFPDLVEAIQGLPATTIVLEGEAICYDETSGNFLPFQETVKRKRKHEIVEATQELPLKFFVFDLLYLNGVSLLTLSHKKRRELLLNLFKNYPSPHSMVIEERSIETAQQLESYFNESVSEGLEGLVVKKPHSHYQPGKRNFNWIKLKYGESSHLTDTLDTVILGYYFGKGKRAQFGIGAFLVGIYDKKADKFETIAKVGTGLKDADWHELKRRIDKIAVSQQPHDVICHESLVPDVWCAPEIVCAVRADNITRSPVHTAGARKDTPGYALRFPRFIGYRPDKSPTEATQLSEITSLEKMQ